MGSQVGSPVLSPSPTRLCYLRALFPPLHSLSPEVLSLDVSPRPKLFIPVSSCMSFLVLPRGRTFPDCPLQPWGSNQPFDNPSHPSQALNLGRLGHAIPLIMSITKVRRGQPLRLSFPYLTSLGNIFRFSNHLHVTRAPVSCWPLSSQQAAPCRPPPTSKKREREPSHGPRASSTLRPKTFVQFILFMNSPTLCVRPRSSQCCQ